MYNPLRRNRHPKLLGRKAPVDRTHERVYSFSPPLRVDYVKRTLSLPGWHAKHDQGWTSSCVGHAVAMERAISNLLQYRREGWTLPAPRMWFNPIWVWNRAKERDEWEDTNPGDDQGTSVNAGCKVARDLGMRRVDAMELEPNTWIPRPVNNRPPDLMWAVSSYRWASTVDDMRTAIAMGIPVVIGVNWYNAFYNPVMKLVGGIPRWYIGVDEWASSGIAGGHAVVIHGANDDLQAFKVKNSWGTAYPGVWLPYATMQRLLDEDGEALIVTDR